MVVISYSGKEANAKIVYYGPGLGGKTTNLEFVYDSVPASSRGKMVSMKTQTDRTLFFDFLPLDLGELGGFKTRFLLYTVPGQVFYNATRKLVLRGVDAIAFVADSQLGKMDENKESLANLEENLAEYDLSLENIPWVMQYNKRDLPEIYTVEELNRELNSRKVPFFEAIATEGVGVFETFRGLSRLLLEKLSEEIGQRMIISKHSGREQDIEQATAALKAEAERPQQVPLEAAGVELSSSTCPAEEVLEHAGAKTGELIDESSEPVAEGISESVLESLEEIDEKSVEHSVESETITESEAINVQADEGRVEEAAAASLEQEAEPTGTLQEPETLPLVTHEQERVEGFFTGAVDSPPLDTEIQREEVILSEEAASEVESETPEEELTAQIEEDLTEPSPDEIPSEPPAEEEIYKSGELEGLEWEEAPHVQALSTEFYKEEPLYRQMYEQYSAEDEELHPQEPQHERPVAEESSREEAIEAQSEAEPSEEEPSFLGIVRRNNVGVFEKASTFPQPDAQRSERPEIEEKSVEQVVEIPIRMLPGEEEKEVTLTIRIRLKPIWEKEEVRSEEFMFDGISK